MKQLAFVLLITFCLVAYGQNSETVSYKGSFNVYPVDTLGVVLLNRNMVQLSSGDLALEYIGLNSNLKEQWKNLYPFSQGMSPVFQQVTAKGIMLLFADKSGENYELIKANAEYGDYERFQYQFSNRVRVTELDSYYDHVWITGYIGTNPVLFKLKPDNTYETVPTGVPGAVKYIGQTTFNRVTKGLDFLILADINKKDALVWRSLGLEGNVLRNEILTSFDKKKVRSLKATYSNSTAHVAGTYSKGSKDRIVGLFWGNIEKDNSGSTFNEFKELEALTAYKPLKEVLENDLLTAKKKKFRAANMSAHIDGVGLNDKGDLRIAIEVYKPEYRSRGALEKEFIARDRMAQIDQNVYGRQDLLEASGGPGLDDRFERASATDQLQMRFMDQSLSKAVNQGVSYNHTAFMTIGADGDIKEAYGLGFDLLDYGSLIRSDHFVNGRLRYPNQNVYYEYDVQTKAFKSLKGLEGTSLINWTNNQLLAISFDKETQTMTFSAQPIN